MEPGISTSLLLSLVFLGAAAFFVAAEFALITARRGRFEPLARDGDPRAAAALRALARAEELALTAQLGNSTATLALGAAVWHLLSNTAVDRLSGVLRLSPDVAASAALAVSVLLTLIVHVILGQQIPRVIGTHRADGVVLYIVAGPLRVLAWLLRPLIWAISMLVRLVLRLLGITSNGVHPLVHTPEEIRMLVTQGHEHGVVEEDEREMIHGVFEFSDTVAREVMTPRTDMVAIPVDVTLEELVRVVTTEGHSRLPVYEGTIDSVVGVLLAKDLLPILWRRGGRPSSFDVRKIMREPYFVPDTKPVDDILAEFRHHSVHLAIVLDEFGGTYGLVTMEDLLEEIVGEINDEYDVAEPEFFPTPEGDVLIDGGASISEVNERFDLGLPEEDFDTIGGFIFGALGRVPLVGDVVEIPSSGGDLRFLVEELEDRRVTLVRFCRPPAAVDPAA